MSDERVERVEHVEHVIRGAIGKMDREWQKKIGGESAGKSRMDDFAYVAARAAVAALDEEPTLEDVLNAARWITHIEVMANEDEHYDALITGYVSEDGFRSGEGTGPTIDAAIRAAVANAKEQG